MKKRWIIAFLFLLLGSIYFGSGCSSNDNTCSDGTVPLESISSNIEVSSEGESAESERVCVNQNCAICDDNNSCTTNSCDSLTGACKYIEVNCEGEDMVCDSRVGECVPTTKYCDGGCPPNAPNTCEQLRGCKCDYKASCGWDRT